MKSLEEILSGGDLRSIGKSNSLVQTIRTQADFDALFNLLFHSNRVVVMRAADSIEKATINNTAYLQSHKLEILQLCRSATDKELVWHLAQLVPRVSWNIHELKDIWQRLSDWASDKQASRIVRVNALQGLADLLPQNALLLSKFNRMMEKLNQENIPSLKARTKRIKSQIKS